MLVSLFSLVFFYCFRYGDVLLFLILVCIFGKVGFFGGFVCSFVWLCFLFIFSVVVLVFHYWELNLTPCI